jgi:hypothetical protein
MVSLIETLVKSDTTSKLTMISWGQMQRDPKVWTNSAEFLTW